MKTFLQGLVLVSAISVVQLFCLAVPTHSQGRTDVVAEHSTSTLAFLTVLSGETIGRIAAGQTVKLSELSEDNAAAVLEAARRILRVPEHYEARFGGQSVPDEFILMILSGFTVTLRGGSIGTESDITIELARDLPGNSIPPAETSANDKPTERPSVPDPPTLESIILAAPSDPVERADYLRSRALAILEPFGNYRLKQAGIPIELSRFTSPQQVKLSALTEEERSWLQGVYRAFCLQAAELGARLRIEVGQGKGTVRGVPTEWLTRLPPLWSDLGDVTVEFEVRYSSMIVPADRSTYGERGGGWSLPKYGVEKKSATLE